MEFGTGATGLADEDGRELRAAALDPIRAMSEGPDDAYNEVDSDDEDTMYVFELLRLLER